MGSRDVTQAITPRLESPLVVEGKVAYASIRSDIKP